jgi:Zn-dependent protease with chaperone function
VTAAGPTTEAPPADPLGERVPGAGTNARFALLAALLLVGSSTLLIPVFAARSDTDSLGCELAAGADPNHLAEVATLNRLTAQAHAFLACQAEYAPGQHWWQIAGVLAALFAVAGLILAAMPWWRTRSRRLVPLEKLRDAEDVRARLAALAAGRVEPLPTVLVARAALTQGASVLGTNRRPRLRLDGALVAARDDQPEKFDAVVLHELGHIANRDLTVTFATVALWRAFLLVVLLPYLVLESRVLYQDYEFGVTSNTASVQARWLLAVPGLIAGLVYFARADVLRSRELHADRVAHRWGARLDRVWDTRNTDDRRRPGVRRAILADPLRLHPDWDVRRAALTDPAPLFAVDRGLMFLTGATATLLSYQSTTYITWHLTLMSRWLVQAFAAVPASLVSAVVGAVLWRAAAYAAGRGIAPPSGLRAGLWLGSGLVVGSLATGQITGDLWLPRRPGVMLLAVLAGVALACWTAQGARLAALSWPERPPRP